MSDEAKLAHTRETIPTVSDEAKLAHTRETIPTVSDEAKLAHTRETILIASAAFAKDIFHVCPAVGSCGC